MCQQHLYVSFTAAGQIEVSYGHEVFGNEAPRGNLTPSGGCCWPSSRLMNIS
jgi:hypothetical protein